MDINHSQTEICKYLQTVCQFYPQNPTFQETMLYKQFFQSLKKVIPNNNFRKQYVNAFEDLPIDPYLSTRESLFVWLYKIFHHITNVNAKYNIVEGFDMDKMGSLIAVSILVGIAIYAKIRE